MWDKAFIRFPDKISEGGGARNAQFAKALLERNCSIYRYKSNNKLLRLAHGLGFLIRINSCKGETIFFHYSLLLYFFGSKLVTNFIFLKLLQIVLSSAAKTNKITIEVNDLPYEQSIDLELPSNKLWILDNSVFRIKNLNFIFASRKMMQYVIQKYKTNEPCCKFILNGGPLLKDLPDSPSRKRLKLVYTGTLNHGRQIENLISIFSELPHDLILMGEGGEWISHLPNLGDNIVYKGQLSENEAHVVTAGCDCGLIPYDDSRLYYNLCYPTKASFYITAGIPFISTPLQELMSHFSDSYVFFESFDSWRELITHRDFSKNVMLKKNMISDIRNLYTWQYLLRDF
ncbi:hypothetical protein KRX52_09060 [Pseudomonas sp. MAP12]|uniref:Glycosyltransferase n=1 Tax=Geopseudomonas aromaticivorans TaxID=2849492 RepID=A0ABS6MX17_9GAMM|nr:hypothetical protein [Pseudomonas aromaticivorans]MBV2132949.1 hypothetical protein [Pseudomonas aromaticivorans]